MTPFDHVVFEPIIVKWTKLKGCLRHNTRN